VYVGVCNVNKFDNIVMLFIIFLSISVTSKNILLMKHPFSRRFEFCYMLPLIITIIFVAIKGLCLQLQTGSARDHDFSKDIRLFSLISFLFLFHLILLLFSLLLIGFYYHSLLATTTSGFINHPSNISYKGQILALNEAEKMIFLIYLVIDIFLYYCIHLNDICKHINLNLSQLYHAC